MEGKVIVRCISTRSVPQLGVIARVGEIREETEERARILQETGAFVIDGPVAPDAELPFTEMDDLTVINGLGPKSAQALADSGVDTFEDLLAQDPEVLAEASGLRDADISAWQTEIRADWEGGE